MGLQKIDIHHVRNINKQTIYPSSSLNFIYGKNGSGKSAFIEAIYLLGRGKSFRTSSIKSVIAFNQPELIVSAQIGGHQQVAHLGIKMDGKTVEIHKNKQATSKRSILAYTLPLQIIHPKSYELLDAGAQIRREFIDWGVFNHEPEFLSVWKNYKQALAQRNALLKQKAIQQLHVWNQELVNYGTIVHKFRQDYIQKLKPVLFSTISNFLPLSGFDLNLMAGWDEDYPYIELLQADIERDLRDGFTHSGPHRGDFQLLITGKLVKDVVSRGQLKILVICLKLAQVQLMLSEHDYFVCILIDDFAAELDLENRAKVLAYLQERQCQVFITATEKREFGKLEHIAGYELFHVEQGEFKVDVVSRGT